MSAITASLAREFLNYSPETGELSWKKKPAVRIPAGAVAGNVQRNGYRYVMFKGESIRAHRLAWLIVHGEWPSGDIDHINGVRDDNRLENLRSVARNVNAQNERKARVTNKSTGILGAYRVGNTGRFRAIIHVGGAPKNLGRFDTAEAAHEAYVQAKRQFHEGCTL